MNTQKSVYNKLFKNESTELQSHKVELALLDDLSKLVSKGREVESVMVDEYMKAMQSAKKGVPAAKEHLNNLDKVSTILNDLRTQADALGLDITKEKQWRQAYDFTQGNPKAATKNIIDKLTNI
jgi:hypothetical protein